MELAIGDLYRLGELPNPKFVIDGGGNTGMFTLAAAARWPSAQFLICEPVPHNLAIIGEHLNVNAIQAEVLPVALGAERGKARFYCRGATQGSFSPDLPFDSVMEVPVITLSELFRSHAENPALIKLDIEGAEVPVLHEFLAQPRKRVAIIGELHLRQTYKPLVLELLQEHGWSARFFEESENYSQFHFFSPDYAMKLVNSESSFGVPSAAQKSLSNRSADALHIDAR